MNNEIVVVDTSAALMPVLDTSVALARYQAFKQFVSDILVEGTDYGIIPGTDKPTLLKPGAEKLSTFFGLAARFETVQEVENWDASEPFFYYRYKCILRRIKDGVEVGEGEGSANSRESRYRWRWVSESDVPYELALNTLATRTNTMSEFAFAIDKGETSGKYGKPADYWKAWRDAIADGSARKVMRKTKNGESEAYEMGGTQYRIPNPDIESQVNTIQKIGQKRSLIGAVLITVNASDYFTQDLEDLDYGHSAPYVPQASRNGDIQDGTVLSTGEAPSAPQSELDKHLGTRPTHPYTPDFLRRQIEIKIANSTYQGAISAKQRGALVGNLNDLFSDQLEPDKFRHTLTQYLIGKSESSTFTKAEASVLLDWSAKDYAQAEARLIVREDLLAQGQEDMFSETQGE